MAKINIEHAQNKETVSLEDLELGQAFYIQGQQELHVKAGGQGVPNGQYCFRFDDAQIVVLPEETQTIPKEVDIKVYTRQRRKDLVGV